MESSEIDEPQRLWQLAPSSDEFRDLYQASQWGGRMRETILDGIRAGQVQAIEDGIQYLEADPWYFRSGYHKAALAHALKVARRTASQEDRLRAMILRSLDRRMGTEEFREYARLAIGIANSAFLRNLEERTGLRRNWAHLRAKFILELCRKHGKETAARKGKTHDGG
ncbi:MAG: hypothetical protein ACYC35_20225 [Pirellulales bacterium]